VVKVFGSAGDIVKTRIRPNETTIQYATAAAAQHAISSLNGTVFDGSTKPLNIKFLVRRKRASRRGGKSGSGEAKPEGGATRPPRAARDPAAAPSGRNKPRRVDVKNVPASASEGQVRTHFESCGSIDRLTMNDEVVSITFSTAEGAELALAKSGSAIGGARVEVIVSPSVPRNSNRAPRAAADGDEPRAGRARSRPEASPAAVSSLIWVGGLPSSVDEAAVRKMYATYGKISEVVIKHMRDSAKPSFAYVRFETDAAASNALAAPAGPGLTVQRANKLPQGK
jgi:RNA recognition motif-containing protein